MKTCRNVGFALTGEEDQSQITAPCVASLGRVNSFKVFKEAFVIELCEIGPEVFTLHTGDLSSLTESSVAWENTLNR
jgi:hypothetical protein